MGGPVLLPLLRRARALSALLPCAGGAWAQEQGGVRALAGRCWQGDGAHHTLAKTTCLFPVSDNEVNISPGRRFMIDLLVGSLMADGGLESALNAAITAEIQVWS